MMDTRRKYDGAFKDEAVRLVLRGDRSLAEIARNLDIYENMLRTWKNKYMEDPEHSFPGKGGLEPTKKSFGSSRKS